MILVHNLRKLFNSQALKNNRIYRPLAIFHGFTRGPVVKKLINRLQVE